MFNIDDCYTNIGKKDLKEVNKIIDENIDKNDKIIVVLKGTWREYLICTEKQVYIIKKGFMTNHTFGSGVFKMPYKNITNAEVDYHLMTGYFELSSGGLQNKRLNYWSQNANENPATQPNVITINSKELKKQFEKASQIILDKITNINNNTNNVASTQPLTSTADEIKKFKELLDMGAITQEEFDKKKKELLNI